MKELSFSHAFALYYEELPEKLRVGSELLIQKKDILHRIERVLRLRQGEQCTFFNRKQHVLLNIVGMDRQSIRGEVIAIAENIPYVPTLTFLLPVLKRDALAHAVYYLVEAGVNEIWLMQTEKAQRTGGGEKEGERLERIAIAAAEQSKNFAFPEIKSHVLFKDIMDDLPEGQRFYGNPAGKALHEIDRERIQGPIFLTCGPEGDFTDREKVKLQEASFEAVRLTPTILRAETAAFCISSLFRAFFS